MAITSILGDRRYASIVGLFGFVLLTLVACNGDDHISFNKGNQTADVRAARWVRDTTQIDGYAVDVGDPDDQVIDLVLLDAGGAGLARLTVRVLEDATDPIRDGAVQAVLRVRAKITT